MSRSLEHRLADLERQVAVLVAQAPGQPNPFWDGFHCKPGSPDWAKSGIVKVGLQTAYAIKLRREADPTLKVDFWAEMRRACLEQDRRNHEEDLAGGPRGGS